MTVPYLKVTEAATYIDVTCDGYVARVYSGGSQAFLGRIYDPSSTDIWFTFGSIVDVGGTAFAISEDTGITLEIIENTPTRVVLRAVGDFEDSSQNDLADEAGSSVIMTFYPDRMTYRVEFNASASITLADSVVNGLCFMDSVAANLTNEDSKYENAGSESDAGSSGVQSSADYIATISDECNVQGAMIESTLGGGTGTYIQYIGDPGVALRFGWNNGTITTLSIMTVMWIIDSASRIGAAQLYSSVERLEMGDQYKDTTIVGPTTGTWADDLILPANIGVDGFASDGAWHGDQDGSDVFKVAFDITRHKPSMVLHKPMFLSGVVGSEVDYLIEQFNFSDNAASSAVVATVGNNAVWEAADGTDRDTDNDSVVTDIYRDRALDTVDTYHVTLANTVYDNAFFVLGGFILKFTPQFGFDDAADQTLWHMFVDTGDEIILVYDAGNDKYELRVSYGGTTTTIDSDAYTENNTLQQPTTIMCGWNAGDDSLFLAINGGVVDTGVNAGTPSAGAAAYVEIGADSDEDGTTSLNADVYLDQYFALDGCILPYGDIFKGNGAVDTAVADKSILSYWDGSDCTSTNIAIGGKTLTQTNGAFITSGGLGNVDDYYDAQGQASSLEVAIAASDVFNITQGMMSMWFNVQTTSSYRVLFGVGVDSDNYMQLSDYFPAAGLYTLTFTTRWGGSTAYTGPSGQISIGTWHYAQCLWNTISKQVAFILDGQLIETETHGGTWAGTPLSYFIGANYLGNDGCDAFYDEFHIADIPYPPQNWSAMGVPLHVPLIEVA